MGIFQCSRQLFLCLFDSAVGEGRWCHLILQKMKQMCLRLNLRAWNSFVLSSARAGEDGAAQWKTPLPPEPQSCFTWTGAFSEMVLIILLSFPMDNFNKLYSWEGFSSPGSCEGGVPWGFFTFLNAFNSAHVFCWRIFLCTSSLNPQLNSELPQLGQCPAPRNHSSAF